MAVKPTSRPAAAARRNRFCVAGSSRVTRCSSRSRRPRRSRCSSLEAASSSSARTGCPRSGPRSPSSAPPAAGRRREPPAAPPVPALERSELQQQRRARAPDAVGAGAHVRRGGLVGAVGPQQQHLPVAQVVGEEDDQIQRRYRPSAGPPAPAAPARRPRARPAAPASPGTAAAASPPPGLRRPAGGLRAGAGPRPTLEGSSVPTKSIERPSRTSNSRRGCAPARTPAGSCRMPGFPATQDGRRPPARPARARAPSWHKRPTNTALARPHSPVSRRRPGRGRRSYASRDRRIRGRRRRIHLPDRCGPALHGDDPVATTDTRRRQMTTACTDR